tara:strand:- start:7839 stop:8657 length:819 start_codon:yes stop_codon:yes gene_type:complete
MSIFKYIIFFNVFFLFECGCSRSTSDANGTPSAQPIVQHESLDYGYEIVEKYEHDPEAFTQGLVYFNGYLYEGTGLYGYSSVRKVDLATGKVIKQYDLPTRYFGEGITVFSNRLLQLTWQKGLMFAYEIDSFKSLAQYSYDTEGWGLTTDGSRLIVSDGTEVIYFRDPFSFEEISRLQVRDGDKVIKNLNELEFIGGEIWANVWQTDRIARINPNNGNVNGWINLAGLLSDEDRNGRRVDVLNGIAFDGLNQRIFVTGKWWPVLYEIKIVEL